MELTTYAVYGIINMFAYHADKPSYQNHIHTKRKRNATKKKKKKVKKIEKKKNNRRKTNNAPRKTLPQTTLLGIIQVFPKIGRLHVIVVHCFDVSLSISFNKGATFRPLQLWGRIAEMENGYHVRKI